MVRFKIKYVYISTVALYTYGSYWGFNVLPNDKILDWSKLKQTGEDILILFQTSPGFYVSAVQVF